MVRFSSSCLLLVLISTIFLSVITAQDKRPNIIFILTDDQRFDALGYAGNALIHTPEMDLLAKTGAYFENALVTTPICAASRASILTGLYERTHRYDFSTGNIRAAYMATSYPTILKQNGYYTGFYGKYGVLYDSLDKQFDIYESYDRNNDYNNRRGYYYKTLDKDTVHLTRYTGQKALDFIDNTDPNKPFCLSLSFSAPHAHDSAKEQYFWQEASDDLLAKTIMPGPELASDEYFNAQPAFVKSGFNRLRWTWRYDTPEKYQHSLKGYYRMISGIDREIAKIRARLVKKGLDKNTVIILMGDNGYFLGERQLAGKWLLYDNSIRVPLIIYDPREGNHQDISEMVMNIDVPSTILDLAGLPQPEAWHGRSLMPLVSKDIKSLDRDTILIEHIWEFADIPPSEGVRTKDWKYFRYVNNKSFEELYHLADDPKEVNNLTKDPAFRSVLEKFRVKCDQLIQEHSDAYSEGPSDLVCKVWRKTTYSWATPALVKSQSAYQIIVASTLENSADNIPDVWDSGQVRSDRRVRVEHEGLSMEAGKTYYWKVRIWDEDNRLSRYAESKFTMD